MGCSQSHDAVSATAAPHVVSATPTPAAARFRRASTGSLGTTSTSASHGAVSSGQSSTFKRLAIRDDDYRHSGASLASVVRAPTPSSKVASRAASRAASVAEGLGTGGAESSDGSGVVGVTCNSGSDGAILMGPDITADFRSPFHLLHSPYLPASPSQQSPFTSPFSSPGDTPPLGSPEQRRAKVVKWQRAKTMPPLPRDALRRYAIVIVQAWCRRHLAAAAVRRLRDERRRRRALDHAAARIQALPRCAAARRELVHLRRQDRAARRIQRLVRRVLDASRRRARRRRQIAAVVLHSLGRRDVAREDIHRRRVLTRLEEREARKIQRRFREHLARRELSRLRQRRASEPAARPAEMEPELQPALQAVGTSEEMAAAAVAAVATASAAAATAAAAANAAALAAADQSGTSEPSGQHTKTRESWRAANAAILAPLDDDAGGNDVSFATASTVTEGDSDASTGKGSVSVRTNSTAELGNISTAASVGAATDIIALSLPPLPSVSPPSPPPPPPPPPPPEVAVADYGARVGVPVGLTSGGDSSGNDNDGIDNEQNSSGGGGDGGSGSDDGAHLLTGSSGSLASGEITDGAPSAVGDGSRLDLTTTADEVGGAAVKIDVVADAGAEPAANSASTAVSAVSAAATTAIDPPRAAAAAGTDANAATASTAGVPAAAGAALLADAQCQALLQRGLSDHDGALWWARQNLCLDTLGLGPAELDAVLIAARRSGTRLHAVIVRGNRTLGRGVGEFLRGESSVEVVMLERESIRDATDLVAALRVNTVLRRLSLDGNLLGDAGAAQIADALRRNRGLTALSLRSNGVGGAGLAAIMAALAANPTLTELDLGDNACGSGHGGGGGHDGGGGGSEEAAALLAGGSCGALTRLVLDGNGVTEDAAWALRKAWGGRGSLVL